MKTTKRNYEALYVVDTNLEEEQVESIITRFSKSITDQGGEVQAAGVWDRRRLAYEVKGRREGLYILMYFLGEPEVAKELDRIFRISDEVLRFIIVRVEPDQVDTSWLERPRQAAPAAAEEEQPEAETQKEEAVAEAPAEAAPEAEAKPAEAASEEVSGTDNSEKEEPETTEDTSDDAEKTDE